MKFTRARLASTICTFRVWKSNSGRSWERDREKTTHELEFVIYNIYATKATTATAPTMEYVFIYVEFISLVSCAVVCSVPYVRREVYGFGWLPDCLMSMPSSLCSQAHQHRHSTPDTNISSQQYLQNVERIKQHLCQHISRMVPLYRIFVSPSFTSLRRGTYGENESNHPTNNNQPPPTRHR